jgi:DNA-binding transcriptional regulator YbjK
VLLNAAVEVISRDGVAGLTHRAVAAAAGVPSASPNYYFEGVDDILVAALTQASDRYVQACDELAEEIRGGADFATALADMVVKGTADTHLMKAEYELYLVAARRTELRPIALRWVDRLSAIAAQETHDPGIVRAIVALIEGTLVQAMLGRVSTKDDLRAALRKLIAE